MTGVLWSIVLIILGLLILFPQKSSSSKFSIQGKRILGGIAGMLIALIIFGPLTILVGGLAGGILFSQGLQEGGSDMTLAGIFLLSGVLIALGLGFYAGYKE